MDRAHCCALGHHWRTSESAGLRWLDTWLGVSCHPHGTETGAPPICFASTYLFARQVCTQPNITFSCLLFLSNPLQAMLPPEAATMLAGMSTKQLMWWRVMAADFGGGMDATGEQCMLVGGVDGLRRHWKVGGRQVP